MTQYKAETLNPIKSPVTQIELADWLRGDEGDPIYSGLLVSATSIVINYLQRELIARDWILTYQDWPTGGTMVINSLSQNTACYQNRIELPYANLIGVDAVIAYGEALTADDYTIINQLPAQLCFESFGGYYSGCSDPALQVQYRAGFGEVGSDVPEPIKQGLLMVAGYLYLNRGCSSQDALNNSGAGVALQPFRVRGGVIV